MKLSWIEKIIFFSVIALVYILAWKLQNQFLLKGDVIWQMHMAKLMLAGGDYVKDFYEINPPLSIYLYMPAVILQKTFLFSTTQALRIYIFTLSTVSLIICSLLAKNIFFPKDNILKLFFVISLAFVYLVIPLGEFGQRECLLMYLTMPYFFLVSLRLMHKKINFLFAVAIGLIAGLGFAIKPFFLLAFAFVELYFICNQARRLQSVLSWLRPETLSIPVVIILYVIFIYHYHLDYIKTVIPIATRFYYKSFGASWTDVVLVPVVFYIAITPFFCFIPFLINPYKKLCGVLIAALYGFLSAYFVQQIPWYYHLLPAFMLALLLNSLLFGFFLGQIRYSVKSFLCAWIFGVLIFAFPYIYVNQFIGRIVLQKNSLQPLIDDLQKSEHGRSVYYFSTKTAYMVSVLGHAGTIFGSRLQFLLWMQQYFCLHPSQSLSPQQKLDEKFFVTMLADDLNRNKPDLIYVDKGFFPVRGGHPMQLDYIKILSHYANFRKAWQRYHYVKTVEYPDQYKFEIYQR